MCEYMIISCEKQYFIVREAAGTKKAGFEFCLIILRGLLLRLFGERERIATTVNVLSEGRF